MFTETTGIMLYVDDVIAEGVFGLPLGLAFKMKLK